VKCTVYASFRPSTATSKWLPGKWRHFRVTSGHLKSGDAISRHVTASSCELQPCRKGNVQYRPVFGVLSHFQVTSGQMTSFSGHSGHLTSRDVISCHVTALSSELQPWRKWNVLYTPVSTFYSHFQVTFGQIISLPGHFRAPELKWLHFLSCDCLLMWATAL